MLVESYQILLPNTANETLQVLRVIAQQNYLMIPKDAVAVASTATPPASTIPTVLSSSSSLILVNVLWFASLTLSLVAASFGMIVKHWLREYLTYNNPSPQARLRVRRSREPSMESWKVFEIAAALPFLLQLALALFFAGLCIFTISVHTTVGNTTSALVAGWAFSFIIVTILPAFYPRCPYKTAFLKKMLKFIHTYLPSFLKPSDGYTEKIIAMNDSADLNILIDVDALQADDELLGTTILESIGQFRQPKPVELVGFLKRVLNHRCQLVSKMGSEDLPWPINSDLLSLSDRGKRAICDIVARYVRDSQPPYSKRSTPQGDSEALNQIWAFLVSPNLQPLAGPCAQLVRENLRTKKDVRHLLVFCTAQWRVRAINNGQHLLEILGTLQSLRDLLHLSFDATFEHLHTAMQMYYMFTAGSPQLQVWKDWAEILSPNDIIAIGAFICNNVTTALRGYHTAASAYFDYYPGPTQIPAPKTSEEDLHSIYQATKCILFLKQNLLNASRAPPGAMRTPLSTVLAETLTTVDRPAAREVVRAYLEEDETFFSSVLPSVLDDTRLVWAESGKSAYRALKIGIDRRLCTLLLDLKTALSNIRTILNSEAFLPRTYDGLNRHLKLCFMSVCLVSSSRLEEAAIAHEWEQLCVLFMDVLDKCRGTAEGFRAPAQGQSLSHLCLTQLRARNVSHPGLQVILEELEATSVVAEDMPPAFSFTSVLHREKKKKPLMRAVNQVRILLPDTPLLPRQRTIDMSIEINDSQAPAQAANPTLLASPVELSVSPTHLIALETPSEIP